MKNRFTVGLLLLSILLLSGCVYKQTSQNSQAEPIIKVQQQSPFDKNQQNQTLKTYQSKKYGFGISFPLTWRSLTGDFNYNEEVNPDFSYVGFSPDGTRFMIVQIYVLTHDQWNRQSNKEEHYILGKNERYLFTTTIDPKQELSDNDCVGGGQFDDFERDRCKEVPKILRTFFVTNS